MSILIILEDSNGKIHRMGLESIAGAQKLASSTGLKTSAVVMGSNADALADEASQFDLGEVIRIKDELLSTYSSDGYAHAVKQIIDSESPAYVLFGHSYQVRDYVPKLSAKLMKPFLADNIALNVDGDTMTLTKQMFNAKLFSDVTARDQGPHLISFQSAAYNADTIAHGSPSVRDYEVSLDPSMLKTQSEEPFKESAEDLDLAAAELIVSVGRGIGKEENIPLAQKLAKTIGAELSSSRPV
jgi:Electron transfer flavoprotein, alpha subunit